MQAQRSNVRVDAVIGAIDGELNQLVAKQKTTENCFSGSEKIRRASLEILKDNADLRKTLNGIFEYR